MENSNKVIYLRYRPETFDELIGQDHVVTPLKNALDNDKVAHAYLFSGPRGCGKTTSARILARCLNCEKGVSSKPCGECQSCKDLGRGGTGSLDVLEMDAASHGHVDDARDLEQKLSFATVKDRYRIVILDEAHMITKEGFNALLKSVEEPPPHVKFIFATTEPEKVISTIRSRTYHYPFKLVPSDKLKKYIKEICDKEKVKISENVLDMMMRAGGGSVRDTESILDQIISGANKNGVVDDKIATALMGFTPVEIIEKLIKNCFENNASEVFKILAEIVESGQDEKRFFEDTLSVLQKYITESVLNSPNTYPFNKLASFAAIIDSALYEATKNLLPQLHLTVVFSKILLKLNPVNDISKSHVAESNNDTKVEEEKQVQGENNTQQSNEIPKQEELSMQNEGSNKAIEKKNIDPDWIKVVENIGNQLTKSVLEKAVEFEKWSDGKIYISINDTDQISGFSSRKQELLDTASKILNKNFTDVIISLPNEKSPTEQVKQTDTDSANENLHNAAEFVAHGLDGKIE